MNFLRGKKETVLGEKKKSLFSRIFLPFFFVFFGIFIFEIFCLAEPRKIPCPRCGYTNYVDDKYCIHCAMRIDPKSAYLTSPDKKGSKTFSKTGGSQKSSFFTLKTAMMAGGGFGLAGVLFFLLKFRKKGKTPSPDVDKTRLYLRATAEGLQLEDPRRSPAVRRFERFPVKIDITFNAGDGERVKGFVIDLSMGGVGFLTKKEMDKGTRVEIFFPLANGEEIKFGGEVVFIAQLPKKSFRIGVQFFHLFFEQQAFINEVLKQANETY